MFSDKTIYKLIDLGLLEVRNIDLPRKVRFRPRRKQTTVYKIDKNLYNVCYFNFTIEGGKITNLKKKYSKMLYFFILFYFF